MMRIGGPTLGAILAVWISACATDPQARPPSDEAAATATGLTATLAGDGHIELRWKDNAAGEAGYFVEYTTDPDDEFVLLNAVPRDATLALHPDLAPDTRFIYRVVPFFGEASSVASVTTGTAAVARPAPASSGRESLRAELLAPTRVGLEWKDGPADQDGYLIEGTAGFDDFRVFAYVPPNVASYVVEDLPTDKKCYFRVRPFRRGKPSPTAERTTGRRTS